MRTRKSSYHDGKVSDFIRDGEAFWYRWSFLCLYLSEMYKCQHNWSIISRTGRNLLKTIFTNERWRKALSQVILSPWKDIFPYSHSLFCLNQLRNVFPSFRRITCRWSNWFCGLRKYFAASSPSPQIRLVSLYRGAKEGANPCQSGLFAVLTYGKTKGKKATTWMLITKGMFALHSTILPYLFALSVPVNGPTTQQSHRNNIRLDSQPLERCQVQSWNLKREEKIVLKHDNVTELQN